MYCFFLILWNIRQIQRVQKYNIFCFLYSLYRRPEFKLVKDGPGDLGSIPGRVIPKTLKIALDTSLLNTQQYKVSIESKVDQSRERSSARPYTSV